MAEVDLEEIVQKIKQNSINQGLSHLFHSDTMGIAEYIDYKQIDKKISELSQKKKITKEDLHNLQNELFYGIAGGKYLTENGKKIALLKAGEGKGFLEKIAEKFGLHYEKPDYISKGARASSKIIDLIKLGNYNAPELEEKANELKNLGMYKAAAQIWHEEGFIRGYDLKQYKKGLDEKAKKGVKDITEIIRYKSLENTVQAAALIAGIFLLAFSSANITGFVIAGKNISPAYSTALGFILLIVSLFFSLRKQNAGKNKEK